MTPRGRRWRRGTALITVGLLASAPALADEAADTAAARALGAEGVTLANAGNCKDAAPRLERAEKLHHAPTTATRLGECEIELGKLVRGTERLQRVVREPLPPNAHPAFLAAATRARKVLDATLPRLATFRLGVAAPPGTKLIVRVDDEVTSDALVDADRPIDPGTHNVTVSADGFLPGAVSVTLDEGQAKAVVVELHRDPSAAPVAGPTAPGATDGAAPASDTAGSKIPAVVAFGVAALGLGAGIYGAAVVSSKQASLDRACDTNRVCPEDRQGDIHDAKTWASVSTVGFLTAGIGTATGVVLLLLSGPTSSRTGGAHVRPVVGLGSAGLDGVF